MAGLSDMHYWTGRRRPLEILPADIEMPWDRFASYGFSIAEKFMLCKL
ncbi:hypothetical protein SAMN05428957_103270 [Oryzisolibacter propanilivorax]|uniref:Uncharacterized protein n=1 Tax=Oryzisolibacter propanilivorax TaxID=1527607 RepID=A0A1G9RGX3_9BURK|nr:hypothetical protein [Oryzisolibacter propanilivorax]SDM22486.1 hypothetical protein SAMN05428957_103270 [Oryzisolibacter propanilivorax]